MPESTPLPLDNIKTLLDAGRAIGGVILEHKGTPLLVLPKGYTVESLKAHLPPQRIEQQPQFTDAASFCEYVKRFKTPATVLFASVSDSGCAVLAVLDYHQAPTLAAWTQHRAVLALSATKEWKTWQENNGRKMGQTAFALFLEDNARVFESPSGAELLELVLTLEGKSSARYNSAVRLKSGAVKFTFDEDVELRGNASEINGSMELPSTLLAQIAPFEYMQPGRVEARLRYRIENRTLGFWYETVTPHLIVRAAARAALENVEKECGVKVLIGTLA